MKDRKWCAALFLAFSACGVPEGEVEEMPVEDVAIETTAEAISPYTTHSTYSEYFGANFLETNHYRIIGGPCSAGFERSGVNVQWGSTFGGHCIWEDWVSASVTDCRARLWIRTAAGQGGQCSAQVLEERAPRAFWYNAANTSSAQVNTINKTFWLNAGERVVFSTCSIVGFPAFGDTFLRLKDQAGNQVEQSDDACGLFSQLTFTAPSSQNFTLSAGCFSSGSCQGFVNSWFN